MKVYDIWYLLLRKANRGSSSCRLGGRQSPPCICLCVCVSACVRSSSFSSLANKKVFTFNTLEQERVNFTCASYLRLDFSKLACSLLPLFTVFSYFLLF